MRSTFATSRAFTVSCIPNAGLPENSVAHYRLTPVELKCS